MECPHLKLLINLPTLLTFLLALNVGAFMVGTYLEYVRNQGRCIYSPKFEFN